MSGKLTQRRNTRSRVRSLDAFCAKKNFKIVRVCVCGRSVLNFESVTKTLSRIVEFTYTRRIARRYVISRRGKKKDDNTTDNNARNRNNGDKITIAKAVPTYFSVFCVFDQSLVLRIHTKVAVFFSSSGQGPADPRLPDTFIGVTVYRRLFSLLPEQFRNEW